MISVIIPTYNRKEMLIEAINSVKKQNYKDIEIIVIDDNSSDGTKEIMREYYQNGEVRYYRNESNMGPGYNRNLGFQKAKGKYIVFMDDDDYYTDFDFFSKAVTVMEVDGYLAFVSGNAYIENTNLGKRKEHNIGYAGLIEGKEYLINMNSKYAKPVSTFTTVFSSSILREAQINKMKMVNDYAIYLRALLFGNAYFLEDIVGVYREHGNNISARIGKKFLIENLEERVWVKERLKKQVDNKVVEGWWEKQMKTVLRYYFIDSNPCLHDKIDVVTWIIKHSPKSSFKISIVVAKEILIASIGRVIKCLAR